MTTQTTIALPEGRADDAARDAERSRQRRDVVAMDAARGAHGAVGDVGRGARLRWIARPCDAFKLRDDVLAVIVGAAQAIKRDVQR